MDPPRVRSLEEAEVHVASLRENQGQHADRLRALEKPFDTLRSPRWKRILFRLDGWPPWYVVADEPAWRPWRRWWTS